MNTGVSLPPVFSFSKFGRGPHLRKTGTLALILPDGDEHFSRMPKTSTTYPGDFFISITVPAWLALCRELRRARPPYGHHSTAIDHFYRRPGSSAMSEMLTATILLSRQYFLSPGSSIGRL